MDRVERIRFGQAWASPRAGTDLAEVDRDAGPMSFEAVAAFDGRGAYPLEVALVHAGANPLVRHIRELWRARQ